MARVAQWPANWGPAANRRKEGPRTARGTKCYPSRPQVRNTGRHRLRRAIRSGKRLTSAVGYGMLRLAGNHAFLYDPNDGVVINLVDAGIGRESELHFDPVGRELTEC